VVGYAVGPAILARRLGGLPPVGVMALSLSLIALVYAPIAFVQRPAVVPSAGALAAIAILGVVCTAAAFVLFSMLIEEVGPVRATVVTYINPAVASLLGVLVLNESFTAAMAIGLGLVILGSVLATRRTGTSVGESELCHERGDKDWQHDRCLGAPHPVCRPAT
jgi:drug/metabolite transporter (DMT)-like permease